jgi:carboxymethylenebutenolidase
MRETKRQQHNITSGYIQIVVEEDARIPAYWAHPTLGATFPGVVLLHDDWGLGVSMRSLAHRLAEVGCYVLVPDLFDGHRATNQISADGLKRVYAGLALPKANAALEVLVTHRKTNGVFAMVGWELGAQIAVQSALATKKLNSLVAFYGDLSLLVSQLGNLSCPLMTIYGEKDALAAQLIPVLNIEFAKTPNQAHQMITYPMATCRFCNEMTDSYQPDIAEEAWNIMLDFLEQHRSIPSLPTPDKDDNRFFKTGRIF